jgi:hypothetical protein
MCRENFQQKKLFLVNLIGFSLSETDRPTRSIDNGPTTTKELLRALEISSQGGLAARDQFGDAEWLDHVIICPRLEQPNLFSLI